MRDEEMRPMGEIAALMGAARQVAHVGTQGQVAQAGTVLADARRSLYRILADEPAAQPQDDA